MRAPLLVALLLLAAPARAQNPLDRGPAWAGTFGDEAVGVGAVLFPASGDVVEGAIVIFDEAGAERLHAAAGRVDARGVVRGTFQVREGERYPFEARADDRQELLLESEGARFRLRRERGGPRSVADLRRALRAHRALEGEEARVVAALRALEQAQEAFRRDDLDRDGAADYGTLEELIAARRVDEALARAPWCGYALEVQPSPLEPTTRWAAVARPHPAREGTSYFMNHAGVVHHSSLPLTISADCEPPLVSVPLGEVEPDWDARGDARGNEAAAAGAMRTIITSQTLFREGDKEGDGVLDYGSLEELGKAQLVSRVLATGRLSGYLFQVRVSATTPEFLWCASARPIEPGVTGVTCFFVNQTAAIWVADRPIPLDDRCEPPAWASPLPR